MKPFPLRLIERAAAGSLRLWIMLGLLLRLTRLRDAWDPLALVFYTTPWPVMAAGFLVLAAHHQRHGRGHPRRRYLLFTGGALFTWFATSWYDHTPGSTPAAFRVALWNVDRPAGSLPSILRRLRETDADVIALAEGNPSERDLLEAWRRGLPGYTVLPLTTEMLCLVRGEVLQTEKGDLLPGSGYGLTRVRVRGTPVTLLQADIYASPTYSRHEALQRLTARALLLQQENLLVLGDFNTPRESAHFRTLREHGFRHCFEAAGHGLAETWPVPLPVLSLDHIWAAPGLRPLRTELSSSFRTDHRLVVADFALQEGTRAGALAARSLPPALE